VTGSLATLLWVLALRRDGITVTPWQFLRIGTIVTIPALIGALLTAR
jgi:arsenical pump membrane protein